MVADASYLNQTNSEIKVLTALVAALAKVAVIPAPTPGALGSYVMATSGVAAAFGGTVAGTSLAPSNAAGTSTGGPLAGTWTCMGSIGAAGDVSLFVRSA